ncbi:TetR/AcrR family transcriptional regulator [Reyranella sp.]|uniref:TetR/AcrR family transcriptional regulator n=1 Tax=Reyranella sp. TaxID=1929291 RepID=UPI003D0B8779
MAGDAIRPNQRKRTRKDLLQAAAQLARQGRSPSLEDIAAEALVSRATAYRYFPSVEALLAEAVLDIATPGPETLFTGKEGDDPVVRLEMVDTALHDVVAANEPAFRVMLANSLQQRPAAGVPPRQNRRSPLIAAALAPARKQFKPASLDVLQKALALIVGTESMVVVKDVLQLDDAEARRVKRWAIRALVEAARKTS